jgi:hypothetical protein
LGFIDTGKNKLDLNFESQLEWFAETQLAKSTHSPESPWQQSIIMVPCDDLPASPAPATGPIACATGNNARLNNSEITSSFRHITALMTWVGSKRFKLFNTIDSVLPTGSNYFFKY